MEVEKIKMASDLDFGNDAQYFGVTAHPLHPHPPQ